MPADPVAANTATRTCAIAGCAKRVHARGWCKNHYEHWRLHGDPMLGRFYPVAVVHGTANGYMNKRCRCRRCRKAFAAYHRAQSHRVGRSRPAEVVYAERRAVALARDNHGTETRYSFGCRCDLCRTAASTARRRRRAAA